MARASAWIPALALVPLAFAGGWFLGNQSPRVEARSAATIRPSAGPSSSSSAPTSDLARSTVVDAPTTSSVVEAPARQEVPRSEVERLTRRMVAPSVAAPAGSLSLTGRVVDEGGAPLPGVVLRAYPKDSRPSSTDPDDVGRAAPDRPSFQDWVAERAEEFALEQASLQEATSDATGGFTLAGLPEGLVRVEAFLAGWTFDVPNSLRVPWLSDLKIEGVRVHEVPIQVVDADGNALAEAEVHANSLDSGRSNRSFQWTPEKPYARLAPGNWKLKARQRALDHPTAKSTIVAESEEATLSFLADEPLEPLRLMLEPKTSLVGRLRIEPAPDENTWYRVVLDELEAGRDLDDKRAILSDPTRDDWTRTDFNFSGIEPGRYALGVLDSSSWGDEDAPFLSLQEIELVPGLNECELSVVAEVDGKRLVVEVTGPDRRPLSGCNFALHVKDADGNSSDGLRSISAHGGTYELDADGAKKTYERASKGGTLTLLTRHQLYGDVRLPVAVDATSVKVEFGEVGFLEITVGGSDRVSDRVSLSVERAEEDQRFFDPEMDKHKGDFWRYGPMQPGRYRVQLRLRSQRWQWSTVEERTVDVTTGTTVVAMELPVLFSLNVRADGAKSGAWATLTNVQEKKNGTLRARIDDLAAATFENIEAGEYILRVNGLEGMMRVRVPGADVVFTGLAPNAMQVSITDTEGLWGAIGLESGDLIVGLAGKLFENEQQSMALYEPSARWIVWRGDRELELIAPAEPFGDRSRLGVRLTPTVRPMRR